MNSELNCISEAFHRDGFFFPITVFSNKEALEYGNRIKAITESEYALKLGNRGQINQLHAACPFISDIIRTPIIMP